MGVTTNNPSDRQVAYIAETRADLEEAIRQARAFDKAQREAASCDGRPSIAVHTKEVLVGLEGRNTQMSLNSFDDAGIIAELTSRGNAAEALSARDGERAPAVAGVGTR